MHLYSIKFGLFGGFYNRLTTLVAISIVLFDFLTFGGFSVLVSP